MTLLPFFLALSLLLRLSGLATSNLWYDEWISYQRVTEPFMNYFTDRSDFTNGWELLLRLFAWGPHWIIRLPALACAMLSLWLAWEIMRALNFSSTQATISALIMACLPGLLWMAQDARYYAPLAALYMGSVLSALRGKIGWLTACVILSFCVHPIGPAYTVPALGIALLAKSISWRKVIAAGILSAVLWSVWFMMFKSHDVTDYYTTFWTGQLTLTKFVYEYGQSLTVNVTGKPGIMIAFLTGCMFFVAGMERSFTSRDDDLLTWYILATPLIILIVASLTYCNVITYRTLQPAAMGLALVAGRVVAAQRWLWVLVGILLVSLLLNWDPSTRGGDLAAIAERIRYEWRADDCIEYSEFGKPLELLLEDLPECKGTVNGRRWIVGGSVNGELVDRTANAWQIAPVNVYLLEENQ
jgi:hypothetical protein